MTNQTDDELRQDSPAYAPDDDWERVPGPLGVVVSVRVDLESARRLADIAQATHRTQSRVVRDWVIERLAHSATPVETRIAEAASPYLIDAQDRNEALRARYRPTKVQILFVGESPPASGTFFYRANSTLFDATRQGFAEAFGPMPHGEEFLDECRDRGAWLFDLASRPVNRQRGRPRQAAVDAGLAPLAGVLAAEQPRLVIAVKATLENTVRAAAARAGIEPGAVHVLPLPLYQWRSAYVSGLARLLRHRNGGAEPTRQTLHEAMVQVLREGGRTMPARQIANEVNARGLYRRQGGGPLGYQQVLVRARKYPHLFAMTREGVRLLTP